MRRMRCKAENLVVPKDEFLSSSSACVAEWQKASPYNVLHLLCMRHIPAPHPHSFYTMAFTKNSHSFDLTS